LRNFTTGQTRESVIDLDAGMDGDVPTFNFDFGDQTLKPRRTSNVDHDEEEEEEEEEEDEDGFLRPGEDQEKRATMDWTFPTTNNASLDTAKRATMDWKFPQAEPKEPEVPDLKMSLPSAGDGGELPPGFRPRLMHTATEPVGQFHDFIHATRPVPALSGSPNRDSMASTIDLDLGMPDISDMLEMRRPSTASSTAESIMTDMTSGNPFFLEEDPYQRELDRNRYSSHKQYRSEGGQIRRSSGQSIRMHTRGSSMSSMESDIDRQLSTAEDTFGYEYNYAAARDPTIQINGNISFDNFDLSKLPTFNHNSGFAEVRNWTDGLDDMAHQVPLGGMNGRPHARSRQPSSGSIIEPDEIEFPHIIAPHSNALLEDADPQFVMSELNRLLEDFGEGLKATSHAIQQRAEVYIDDGEGEMESGTDGSGGPTGDEEEAF
jgi:hypothetical protein